VVDLTTRTIVQRCYDPDCRNYASQPNRIPVEFFEMDPLTDEQMLEAALAMGY
jgi:hypothetical protein